MYTYIYFLFFLTFTYLALFLKAYFPVNQNVLSVVDPPSLIGNHKIDLYNVYTPQIDRLIFIIIDALREDFLSLENMPYTSTKNSCLMGVKVESPTVTLPRIKALTTGGVPQFVDIILNLGATTKCEDSFLHRAYKAGKKMVFYGDDTWIKIYPDLFTRKEGTTSFYVNDFFEVDDNVTRHIRNELIKKDWDIMFLHYLGLDHIGHVRGPFSNLIKPKLLEMDEVIKVIHEAANTWDDKRTLILVTGDHGMKDSGGHGGTTYAETHVPLIAFNMPCKNKNLIAQTDIPITLSSLFGIQIPANSIGKIILEFFDKKDMQKVLYILYYNLIILRGNSSRCETDFFKAKLLHVEILNKYNESTATKVFELYQKCLNEISDALIKSSTEQNLSVLLFALISTINSLILILCNYFSVKLQAKINFIYDYYISLITLPIIIFIQNLYYPMILIQILFVIKNLVKLVQIVKLFTNPTNAYMLIIPVVLHAVLLLSSSFIEEEHQIFYFFTGTVSVIIFYVNIQKWNMTCFVPLCVIAFLRCLRTFNSTGDQWASYPDLADWFLIEQNFLFLKYFYATSLILVYLCLINLIKVDLFQKFLYIVTLCMIFLFKLYYLNFATFGKVIWMMIVLIFFRIIVSNFSIKKLVIIWILIITLLLRPYNAILIPTCVFCSFVYNKFLNNIQILTLLHIWLGYTLFFCQGHSNSIASVDIASSYIGLNIYIPAVVGLFTLCHTYAFQILSSILLLREHNHNANEIFTLNIINRLIVLIMIYLITIVQRGHLFVWSVFAPKLLIDSVHTTILFIQIFVFCTVNYCKKIMK